MKTLRLISILLAVSLLTGCVAAVVGGAGGAALVGADRRTVGTVTEDQGIEIKAGSRISEKFPDAHVNVTSYNRMVLLTGEAANNASRAEIEKITRAIENVRGIYNEIAVVGNSSISSRTNDAYLTGKVKARFVDGQKFNAVHVKVVTESNTVYLLGMVNRKEADDATEIARTTSGVQKVVRVFEYIEAPPPKK
jgi:osmotically-inducible protein OsmY